MKLFIVVLLLACLFVASTLGYTCPAGSTTTTSVDIQTCDDQERVDGGCPRTSSNGMNLVLDGSQDAPEWLWGALQESSNFKSQFYKLYEVDSNGTLIDGSITELNTFSWTYCSPVGTSNGMINFAAFGTNNNMGIYISGSIANSSTADSFKWSFTLDNYVFSTPNTANDLVLFSKYETEGGDNSGTEDDSHDPNHTVVNSNSFITTATSASYQSSAGTTNVAVTSSATDNGERGYFITFSLAGKNANFVSLTLDPRMGVSTSSAFAPIVSVFGLILVALFIFF